VIGFGSGVCLLIVPHMYPDNHPNGFGFLGGVRDNINDNQAAGKFCPKGILGSASMFTLVWFETGHDGNNV